MNKSPTIALWAIGKIKPYDRNNKRHTEAAIVKLADLIKQYGFDQPIVITAAGEIIKGHRRYAAAKHLKLKQVPVIVRDDLTPSEIKAARIADNAVQDDSEFDYSAIGIDLLELLDDDFDLALTGLDDVDDILASLDMVEAVEPPAKGDKARKLGKQSKLIKPVLHSEQVGTFERALQATGITNRGEALIAICEYYLSENGE